MSSYFDESKQDQWSIGVVWGCYQVHQHHQPYPPLLAFWVRKALKRIKERKLECDAKVLRFCERWCRDAEASLGQCRCKCHRKQPRSRTQRWRSE